MLVLRTIGLWLAASVCGAGEIPSRVSPAPKADETWTVGTTYADENRWNEYMVGDMPLVLSVPHGGSLKPVSVPDRYCPNSVRGTDLHTIELTREIQNVFLKEYGLRPHVIVCNLSRRKIDQNRGMEAGTCGNEEMSRAWRHYHDYIDTAISLAGKDHDHVLFIDIHAHAHSIQRLELGYLINGKELKAAYQGNLLTQLAARSSLVNLIQKDNGALLHELLFGENAFGTLAEKKGIRAIPSQQDPYPKAGEQYLSRGYNTQRYTGEAYPKVHGIQVECNRSVRTEEVRAAFAKELTTVMVEYMERIASDNVGLQPAMDE